MKLTWFATTVLRIHIGGQILVSNPDLAPAFVARHELVSGADRVFSLGEDDPALPLIDAAKWRERVPPKAIDDSPHDLAVNMFRLGAGAVLVEAVGEPPLALAVGSEPPRFGRWADNSVVVLFGAGEAMVAVGKALLEMARPRLIALAADEAAIDVAIAGLAEHLGGAGLVSLEPGLALEV